MLSKHMLSSLPIHKLLYRLFSVQCPIPIANDAAIACSKGSSDGELFTTVRPSDSQNERE